MADDHNQDHDLRPEYCREDFPGGLERGRYAARMAEGFNIVRIDPDLLGAFPDSVAVNEALRALLRIAERSAGKRSFHSLGQILRYLRNRCLSGVLVRSHVE